MRPQAVGQGAAEEDKSKVPAWPSWWPFSCTPFLPQLWQSVLQDITQLHCIHPSFCTADHPHPPASVHFPTWTNQSPRRAPTLPQKAVLLCSQREPVSPESGGATRAQSPAPGCASLQLKAESTFSSVGTLVPLPGSFCSSHTGLPVVSHTANGLLPQGLCVCYFLFCTRLLLAPPKIFA